MDTSAEMIRIRAETRANLAGWGLLPGLEAISLISGFVCDRRKWPDPRTPDETDNADLCMD